MMHDDEAAMMKMQDEMHNDGLDGCMHLPVVLHIADFTTVACARIVPPRQ